LIDGRRRQVALGCSRVTVDARTAVTRRVLGEYFDALRSLVPEQIGAVFAEDGEIEDPVGGPVHRGRPAITSYFAAGMCAGASSVEIEIVSAFPAGPAIAAHWRMTAVAKNGRRVEAAGIDVVVVDDHGRIRRAEGYWDRSAFRAALAS
jgi:steroid Delta-isomerase